MSFERDMLLLLRNRGDESVYAAKCLGLEVCCTRMFVLAIVTFETVVYVDCQSLC